MRRHERLIIHHHFEYAGCKYLHEICILAQLFAVHAAEHAVVHEVIQRRLYLRDGLPHLRGEPARSAFLAQSRGDGDIGLVIGDNVLHAVILRSVLIYLDEHT